MECVASPNKVKDSKENKAAGKRNDLSINPSIFDFSLFWCDENEKENVLTNTGRMGLHAHHLCTARYPIYVYISDISEETFFFVVPYKSFYIISATMQVVDAHNT